MQDLASLLSTFRWPMDFRDMGGIFLHTCENQVLSQAQGAAEIGPLLDGWSVTTAEVQKLWDARVLSNPTASDADQV